jgi:DNA (cytosine-5)-methyltransferase 1
MLTAIDLFAGLGGNTLGASRAGVNVVWAANHNRVAVETHAANHPDIAHSCQDLEVAKFSTVPDHDILIASPCCQGHSDAKGVAKATSEESRSTAWCVFTSMSKKRPLAAVIENVPEFTRWTESDDVTRKGSVYRHWLALIMTIGPGYHFSSIELDSADLGVPQNRKRLFMVFARKDVFKNPVDIPQPTTTHVPFASIMEDTAGMKWNRVEDKEERTRSFIQRSSDLFKRRPFLVPYYGSTLKKGVGRSIDRPLGTVTTKARYALVDSTHKRLRMLRVSEYRAAMDFPASHHLPATQKDAIMLLGNAVTPASTAYVLTKVKEALRVPTLSMRVR